MHEHVLNEKFMNVAETFPAGIRVSMDEGVNHERAHLCFPEPALRPIAAEILQRHATTGCATSRPKVAQPPRRLSNSTEPHPVPARDLLIEISRWARC